MASIPRFNKLLWIYLALALSACGGGNGSSGSDISETDTDGDGLTDVKETTIYFTNPEVIDTDGDGYDDYEEIVIKAFDATTNNFQFNPLIADVPMLDVQLSSTPDFGMNYSTFTGTSSVVGTERSNSTSTAKTNSWGGSESHSIEMTHSVGVELSVEHEFSATGGTKVGGKLTYGSSHSETNTFSTEWSNEQSNENTTALNEINTYQNDSSNTIDGGYIQTSIRITNSGDVAYVLDGLTLSAYINNPIDPYDIKPIATLTYGDNFPSITLTPGEVSPPLTFLNSTLGIDTVKDLLENSTNLIFEPVVGTMTGNGDINFELASTNINTRTAKIIIDYGINQPVEKYRVATVIDQSNPGITVKNVLTDILKINYNTGIGSWYHGVESSPRDSFTGLTQVRTSVMDDVTSSYWIVAHTYNTDNGATRVTDYHNLILASYDFDNIIINKGDVLHLTRVQDNDRDGLGNRVEFLYKTDPDNMDTDGDGLSDSVEISGWEITFNGVAGTRVYSNPLKVDTDGDGNNDNVEKLAGTHPNFVDNNPPTVDSLVVTMDGFNVSLEIDVSDLEDTIESVDIDWGDGFSETTGILNLTHSYVAGGSYTISVTATDSFNAVSDANTVTADAVTPTSGLIFHLKMDADITDELSHPTKGISLGNPVAGFTDTDRHGLGDKALFMRDNTDSQGYAHLIVSDHLGGEGMTGSYTMAIWAMTNTLGNSEIIMGQQDYQKLYFSASNTVAFGDSTNKAVSSDSTVDNVWTFYVGVAEVQGADTVLTLYKDGVATGTTTLTDSKNANPNSCNIYVGNHATGECDPAGAITEFNAYDLTVDDARVYNRALTPAEVNALYHEGGF